MSFLGQEQLEGADEGKVRESAVVFESLVNGRGNAHAKPRPVFEIVPHVKAPLFKGKNAQKVLQELAKKLENAQSLDEELAEVMKQAGYVSLWFFLKFIAGYANPFNELNDDLHLDMCNFRQSLLKPGTRGGMFIPRGHFKSTVVTEGGTAWELLRNPDLRIRITNATAGKADGFMHSVKAIFDSNDLVRFLYPEHCPKKNAPRWNDTEIVMPNRSKHFREASVEAGGVGGASEGHHYDLHVVDDIIGLGDLNAMSQSGTTMAQARKWFWGSEKPLLVSVKKSRVIVVGTRYAVDDVYDDIVKKACEIVGAPMQGQEPGRGKGSWRVYYRKGIENGQVIFPENFDVEGYREMALDNWWTFVTQYLNDPFQAGLAEFSEYELPTCWLDFDAGWGKWFVLWDKGPGFSELERCALEDMDVVMAVDPAATEKYVSAKTSRTAVGILACHFSGKKFLLDLRADYVSPTKMFDWMFELARKFSGCLRGTFLEANAGFKVLGPIIHEEEKRRGIWLNLRAGPAYGEKVARIRSILQPEFEAGRLYVADGLQEHVLEEVKAFPQSPKKDILDMMANGVSNLHVPEDPQEGLERAMHEQVVAAGTGRTGY